MKFMFLTNTYSYGQEQTSTSNCSGSFSVQSNMYK